MKLKIFAVLAFVGFCGMVHAESYTPAQSAEITKCMMVYQKTDNGTNKPTEAMNQYVRSELGPEHMSRIDKLARSYMDDQMISMVSNIMADGNSFQSANFGRAMILSLCLQTVQG